MRKKRVLIAHNNINFIEQVDEFFNRNEFYTLSSYALNGQDLLSKLSLDDYEIILVKNELVHITGLYALEELLSNTKKRPDYIILVTPFINQFLINKCQKLGIYYLKEADIRLSELQNILFDFEIKNVVRTRKYFNPQVEVIRLIKQIGLLKTYIGYTYFEYILNMMLEKSENIYRSMKSIYQNIGEHFNASATSVEKAMRTCIRSSLSKSESFIAKLLFGYHENDYPSTSMFLQVCIKTLKEQKNYIMNRET